MKIYTKTGDRGETSLFGGTRVSKTHLRIDAYGTVDELNSVIGICRSMNGPPEADKLFEEIQNDLFVLGADLASPAGAKGKILRIEPGAATRLEGHIDRLSAELRPLTNFILPGGNPSAAMLHFACTVCRRAERLTVRLAMEEGEAGKSAISGETIVYLNRLSDFLFVMARWINSLTNTAETGWKSDL